MLNAENKIIPTTQKNVAEIIIWSDMWACKRYDVTLKHYFIRYY